MHFIAAIAVALLSFVASGSAYEATDVPCNSSGDKGGSGKTCSALGPNFYCQTGSFSGGPKKCISSDTTLSDCNASTGCGTCGSDYAHQVYRTVGQKPDIECTTAWDCGTPCATEPGAKACAKGYICLVNTCCGQPICAPYASSCNAPVSALRGAAPEGDEGDMCSNGPCSRRRV